MGGFLAREAARATTEYFPQAAPSPLATFASNYIQVHFQIDPEGAFSSPQLAGRERSLERLVRDLDVGELRHRVTEAEALFAQETCSRRTNINRAKARRGVTSFYP